MIRRRLRQKMEFLTDSGADLIEPAAGDLEAYFADNEPSFQRGPRLAFEQIYLGQSPDAGDVARALSLLESDPTADLSTLGERSLLPAQLALSAPQAIDGAFGDGFFERIAGIEPGEWAGPVKSGFGAHFVRVLESLPARTPAFEDVRDAVLREWKEARAQEIRELHYARISNGYTVEIRGRQNGTEEPVR